MVGASAGGIDALSRFVAALPSDLAAPVVIAQHLDPARPSHLAEILSRQSSLPVRIVEERQHLAPGTIFVVPSNRHVTITDHQVEVHPDAARRPTPSVDLLLATAASVFGERLIAVILTGAGSDGAAGAHAVKEAGGTIIIQDPETAAFPSMPRSLAPSLVDLSIPVERMGSTLAALLETPQREQVSADQDVSLLFKRLRERQGIDFSAYKPPTITRRLWRRLTAVGAATVADYLLFLDSHPEEEQRLIADFLIKVTRFFRDPALFATLRAEIIPELVATAIREGRELRLWSAGCATGEEAYSLALLVADAMASSANPPPVRIFATDLDDQALDFARRGIYPASALSEVPDDLLTRFFTSQDGTFEIAKAVRGLIIFGTHDLAQRPPFPYTDLVLCRNVLIYFTPELQRRALEIFAYSLRENGVLVLGTSETADPVAQSFAAVDRRLRIYRRHGPRLALPPARLPAATTLMSRNSAGLPRSQTALERALQQAEADTREAQSVGGRAEDLVRRLPIGVAIIDRDYDLALINGAARELLGIHGLAIGQDLIHLAQRIPSTALRTGIDAVLSGAPTWALPPITTTETATGETRHLSVNCYPDRISSGDLVTTVLVLISDITASHHAVQTSSQAAANTENELHSVREAHACEIAALRDTVDRQANTNHQLLRANRELTDAIDRLREEREDLKQAAAAAQVAAEEIETLNEELQSSNEELETLHEEAQATVEELHLANDELRVQASIMAARDAAEAANQAKSAFLAMTNHELRTPLQAVLGYSEFLLADTHSSLTAEQRDDLGYIQQGGRRMLKIINELLDLSRIEAGALHLVLAPVDLSAVLEEVRQDVAPQASEKGLALCIDLPPRMPPVLAEAERLRQILLNLVGNAVKFTDSGTVEVTAQADGESISVAVRDTGSGIAPEDLPIIFEAFRQVDSRPARRHGGAGLGLAIALKLAELMHGQITVESIAGEGSTFTLVLAAAPPASG